MKIAIMQPYFFPYIGYWQLIHAVDCFVSFDEAQYMKGGWVNRNRILNPNGGWQYITVPVSKHRLTESIKNVQAHPNEQWRKRILGQLAHYKKYAGYFDEINDLVIDSLNGISGQSIAAINLSIIKKVCAYLDVKKEFIASSEQNFDFKDVGDAGEWVLWIAEQLDATEYINPVAGATLYSGEKFSGSGISLSFLSSQAVAYAQREVFEPSLSIIDVLMFNGKEGTKDLLNKYSVEMAK